MVTRMTPLGELSESVRRYLELRRQNLTWPPSFVPALDVAYVALLKPADRLAMCRQVVGQFEPSFRYGSLTVTA